MVVTLVLGSGMRERVTDLGGSFDIESNSQGTAIIVALPLAEQPSGESRASHGSLRGRILQPEGSDIVGHLATSSQAVCQEERRS
jgi:hypothetical protein